MDGINRIQEMAKGQKNFVLLEIVKYLTSRTDMDEKYLNQEKSLKGMAEYIESEVMKDFCEKMNTNNPSSFAQNIKYAGNNSVKCLPVGFSEDDTYNLAINYFSKSNKELGIEPEEQKTIQKEIKKEIKTEKIIEKVDDEFGSIFGLFDNTVKENETENVVKKQEIEQISLFAA